MVFLNEQLLPEEVDVLARTSGSGLDVSAMVVVQDVFRAAAALRSRLEAGALAAVAPTQVLPATRRSGPSEPPPFVAAAVAPALAPRTASRRQRLGTQLTPVEISSEAAEQAANRTQDLGAQRARTSADVELLQSRLVALDDHVRRLDAQLADTRQHAVSVRTELDGARVRLRTLDEQLHRPT